MSQSMNRLAALLLVITAVIAGHVQAQGLVPYQEGLHYAKIDKASAVPGEKVEVVELFSYLCTHCATIDPYLNRWAAKAPDHVVFRRIPVVFGRSSWELYARGYVTAEIMGAPETAHTSMMDRLWKEKKILRSLDEIAEFYLEHHYEAHRAHAEEVARIVEIGTAARDRRGAHRPGGSNRASSPRRWRGHCVWLPPLTHGRLMPFHPPKGQLAGHEHF